jgi:hypothetical protein
MAERGRRIALVALRLAVGALLVAGVGALAHLPLGAAPADSALRVVLRTQHAKVEICRDRTAEELAALPAHMRQPRDCRETAVDYRLRVAIDGRTLVDRVVAHEGVRRNRPLVADESIPAAAGVHRIAVEFTPVSEIASTPGVPVLPAASFDDTVELTAGRVQLLALAHDGASFQLGG